MSKLGLRLWAYCQLNEAHTYCMQSCCSSMLSKQSALNCPQALCIAGIKYKWMSKCMGVQQNLAPTETSLPNTSNKVLLIFKVITWWNLKQNKLNYVGLEKDGVVSKWCCGTKWWRPPDTITSWDATLTHFPLRSACLNMAIHALQINSRSMQHIPAPSNWFHLYSFASKRQSVADEWLGLKKENIFEFEKVHSYF